jgi:hypothetical protein
MSALLAWLVGVITKDIFNLIWGKISDAIAKNAQLKKQHEEAASQAAQDTEKLKQVTPDTPAKEVDDAIDDSLSHF